MAAILYEPAFSVVTTWFEHHRDRALTLVTVVGGLASTVFVPLAAWLLARLGWRSAVVALAAILASTTIPLHGLVLRRHPHDLGWHVDGEPQPRAHDPRPQFESRAAGASPMNARRTFRTLTAFFVLTSLATVCVAVHLVPYLAARGFPASTAATALAVMGAMQLPGRLCHAVVRRTLPAQWAVASVLAVQAAAVACLPWVAGRVGLLLLAAAFGMAGGIATLLRASIVAQAFDPRRYGRVNGRLVLAAGVYTWSASYVPVFLGLGALLASAALVICQVSLGGAHGH
jgi:cyanate permease